MIRIKTFIYGLVLALGLTGCSFKFTYNQLDWLIPWYLEDYVELEQSQFVWFEGQLEHYLDWHRSKALPDYAQFLEQVSQLSEQNWNAQSQQLTAFSDTQLLALETQLMAKLNQSLEPLISPTQQLIRQLKPYQVQQLVKRFAESNEDFREKFDRPVNELREERAQRLISLLEHFLGDLNAQQLAEIETWQRAYIPMYSVLMESRLQWQAEFLGLLEHSEPLDDVVLQQRLRALFLQRETKRSAEYQALYEQNRQLIFSLLQKIQASSTQAQYVYLQNQLKSYQEDFLALAKQ